MVVKVGKSTAPKLKEYDNSNIEYYGVCKKCEVEISCLGSDLPKENGVVLSSYCVCPKCNNRVFVERWFMRLFFALGTLFLHSILIFVVVFWIAQVIWF